jgi:hypothetical protein
LHETIAQLPVEQLVDAFASAHADPHALQFVSVVSGASQPLPAFPSQLP